MSQVTEFLGCFRTLELLVKQAKVLDSKHFCSVSDKQLGAQFLEPEFSEVCGLLEVPWVHDLVGGYLIPIKDGIRLLQEAESKQDADKWREAGESLQLGYEVIDVFLEQLGMSVFGYWLLYDLFLSHVDNLPPEAFQFHEPRFQGLKELVVNCGNDELAPDIKPVWDGYHGRLFWGKEIIRKVHDPLSATNIVAVLDAFQEQGWPERIVDPLPGGRNPLRLQETIKTLNGKLIQKRIVFFGPGTGQHICWKRS